MTAFALKPATAFAGDKILLGGSLSLVALAVKKAVAGPEPILIFDDATGKVIDLDLRGSDEEIVERLKQDSNANPAAAPEALTEPSLGRRGRPKLGVVSREVTLLPRHWDWLAEQPGGASVALRKLVEHARRLDCEVAPARAAQEAAYRFMAAMAGNLPGFEEAARALFAGNRERFEQEIAAWPPDLRLYALKLAWKTAP